MSGTGLRDCHGPTNSPFLRGALLPLLLVGGIVFLNACKEPATVDKPASELSVKLTVIDTDESPSDGKVPVVMQFFFQGEYVKLSSNAAITCNGVTLTDHGLGYAERVPIAPVGGAYVFQHSRSGVNTTVGVAVPARPVFVSPTAGSSVARSTNLSISYVAGNGSGIRASAGDGSTGLGKNLQPDNGIYTGFDVSSLNAGPGTIGITREVENLHSGGAGFSSVESAYSSGSDINITWL
jgi:hypothetical protein